MAIPSRYPSGSTHHQPCPTSASIATSPPTPNPRTLTSKIGHKWWARRAGSSPSAPALPPAKAETNT
uniref:Uncharacterized protein n=1 Tax=Arundo donax TaxID=35708 RepID=A0A0A9CHD8_ARUDO